MRTILAMIFMTFSTLASAEPSSDIRLLMERPVTLLEWGMFQLERYVNKNSNDSYSMNVSYNWDQNRIYISKVVVNTTDDLSTMEKAKGICKTEFTFLDNRLFITDGEDFLHEYCVACKYFSHDGFSTPAVTEAVEKLKDRFYYSVIVENYSCTRKAYGTSIAITEN